MPKVGVLLSGCGFLDGAEIHESVFTLLALDQQQATIICCAPNIEQAAVVDHQTRQPTGEKRNVLREAARIARCEIRDVTAVSAADLDALILPGGFGAATNLCDFASQGAQCAVDPDVARLIGDMLARRKPIGAICIAPALLARVAGQHGISATVTIGNDPGTAQAIADTGCVHQDCPVDDIVIDEQHKLVTTPAYMLGTGPADVWQGIHKLVEAIMKMARSA
ncbi:MAG: isoprenoid biosynthesis glyoxalase ElbB [Planctomycetota bacterium]